MDKCIFCKKYKHKKNIIYKDKFFYATLDDFPVAFGHTIVVPIKHTVSFFDLTEEEWKQLKLSISEVIKIIEKVNFKNLCENHFGSSSNQKSKKFYGRTLRNIKFNKKPDGYNIGLNEGKAAGRTVNHLHIHIIPRYFGDVSDSTGGIRHIIPGMGNYRK